MGLTGSIKSLFKQLSMGPIARLFPESNKATLQPVNVDRSVLEAASKIQITEDQFINALRLIATQKSHAKELKTKEKGPTINLAEADLLSRQNITKLCEEGIVTSGGISSAFEAFTTSEIGDTEIEALRAEFADNATDEVPEDIWKTHVPTMICFLRTLCTNKKEIEILEHDLLENTFPEGIKLLMDFKPSVTNFKSGANKATRDNAIRRARNNTEKRLTELFAKDFFPALEEDARRYGCIGIADYAKRKIQELTQVS